MIDKNKQRRERWANNPEYREKKNAQQREQYANDPEYREKTNSRNRERYNNNREKINAHRKKRHANNPEYQEKKKAADKKYREDPRYRESKLKYKYGITQEDYDRMLEEQGGKCKICGIHQSEIKVRLGVDHCHRSGKVRGLLCSRCNNALGCLKDDPKLLEKAKQYLERFTS